MHSSAVRRAQLEGKKPCFLSNLACSIFFQMCYVRIFSSTRVFALKEFNLKISSKESRRANFEGRICQKRHENSNMSERFRVNYD